MLIKKKRGREDAEINGSSLADIAFLLLIFFLVTTTINVDTGIGLVLPPEPDPTVEPPPIKEKNLLKILVNAQGLVLMDDEPSTIDQVKDKVMEFVSNNGEDPNLSDSPDKAIVSIKTQREAPYKVYIDMLDEVMAAYRELRDQAAQQRYGVPFGALDKESPQYKQVQDIYPKKISLAEPDES